MNNKNHSLALYGTNKDPSEAEFPLAEIISFNDDEITYKTVFYRDPYFYSSKGTYFILYRLYSLY